MVYFLILGIFLYDHIKNVLPESTITYISYLKSRSV